MLLSNMVFEFGTVPGAVPIDTLFGKKRFVGNIQQIYM